MDPLRYHLFVWVLLLAFVELEHVLLVRAEGGVERETIEMLFQVLSPECRDEMDAALMQPDADMSDDCKKEIERNLEKLQYSKGTDEEGHHDNDGNSKNQAGGKGRKPSSPSSTSKEDDASTTVMMYVVGFLTFIFASAGAYIFIVNANTPKENYRPAKKLSKQEQEKQRQKGMR